MNDIEEALTATLTRRAAAVPSPIGLTAKIRQRHAEQRRRRALVTAASGVAAVTLVTGGWALVDPQLPDGTPTGISAAAGPGDPVKTDPAKTDPPAPPTKTVDPEEIEPSPPASGLPGALEWPARGNAVDGLNRRVIMNKMRAMWAGAPGTNILKVGKDIAPLGKSPRLLRMLYVAEAPGGNILVMQGTDETKRVMIAVFQITDDLNSKNHRLISRGPIDRYRLSSSDVLRFVIGDDVHLLTPPSATAAVSWTPGEKRDFTPVPLKDGMLTAPLNVGPWGQVQVRVGSKIVYQGPITPN